MWIEYRLAATCPAMQLRRCRGLPFRIYCDWGRPGKGPRDAESFVHLRRPWTPSTTSLAQAGLWQHIISAALSSGSLKFLTTPHSAADVGSSPAQPCSVYRHSARAGWIGGLMHPGRCTQSSRFAWDVRLQWQELQESCCGLFQGHSYFWERRTRGSRFVSMVVD